MYLMSYFYAPVIGVGKQFNSRNRGIDESDAERERNQIMNEFYSTELEEEGKDDSDSNIKNRKYKPLSVLSENSPMKRNKKG